MNITKSELAAGRAAGWNVFIALGSLIAIVGIVWLMRTAWFVGHATKVPGQIIQVVHELSPPDGNVDYADFIFRDASSIVYTERSYIGFGPGFSLGKGDKVPILYDQAKPEHATIDSFGTLWWRQSYLAAFSLLFGGFGCILSYFRNRPALFAARKQIKHEAESSRTGHGFV